jgi:actin-like ATPase involved in cell morphogenesis
MGYQLGIDVGTTYTAAAVARDGRTEIFALGERSAAIPSVVFIGEGGTVLVGEGATRRATSDPSRVARGFKRRLGDQTPILLGGVPVSPESLIARLLQWTVHRVSEQEGEKPEAIGISHPANWGPYKKDLLDQAIKIAGLDVPVTALSEPEAAAIHYASTERVEVGDVVAVYDLGGGTFDACALRKTADGFEILGKPEGIERLGGIDFDEAIFDHVLRSVDGGLQVPDPPSPGVVAAAANLRRECVEAKEALSADTEVDVPVLFPEVQTQVRLTRSDFERMIQTPLAETTKALRRALEGAGVEPTQVKKVLLVGGSSRIPLVAQMVSAELGRPVAVDVHPKHSVAFGAGIAAGAALKAADMVEPAAAAGAAAATALSPEQTAAASGGGGQAAIDTVPSDAGGSAPPPDKPSGPSRGLLVGGILAAIAAVVVVVLVLGGGDEGGGGATTAADTDTGTTTTTTAQPFAGSLVPGEWEAVAPMPAARQQSGAAAVKGLVYVVGGLTETVRGTSDVFVYDRGINQWRPGPPLPEPLHHPAVVAYRGEPVVIGGWVPEGSDLIANPSAAVYVLRGSAWEELASLPEPRAAAAAAVVGDEIVLMGGQNASGELMDSTEIFDGESWRAGAPIPTPREHLAAASDGQYAYAVGGRELSADANVDALERYDPASDSWEQLPPMPTARGSLGGAAMIKGELLVVVGGEVVEGALATVEGYSITDEEWGPLPDMPTPRHGPSVTSVGPRVYVFGGATQAGHSASTDLVDVLTFTVEKSGGN